MANLKRKCGPAYRPRRGWANATEKTLKTAELPENSSRKLPEQAAADRFKNLAQGLDPLSRVVLAFAALASLDPDDAALTAEAVIGAAGSPLPTFLAPLDDARFWASLANRQELKAYALASYEAMRPGDQAAFLRYVNGGAAA